jgi:hypothetical protein
MTLADYSMTAFALLNSCRAIAYVPQMIRVYRDPHGAAAVSITTWTLFTAANAATMLYAITAFHDALMALIFGLNALGCALIVGMTILKRSSRTRVASDRASSNQTNFRVVARTTALAALASIMVWLGTGETASDERPPTVARICLDREVQVVTLIEDHGEGMYVRPFVSEQTLAWAGLRWLEARDECYRGHVVEAVALYDEIVMRLSPSSAQILK